MIISARPTGQKCEQCGDQVFKTSNGDPKDESGQIIVCPVCNGCELVWPAPEVTQECIFDDAEIIGVDCWGAFDLIRKIILKHYEDGGTYSDQYIHSDFYAPKDWDLFKYAERIGSFEYLTGFGKYKRKRTRQTSRYIVKNQLYEIDGKPAGVSFILNIGMFPGWNIETLGMPEFLRK